MREGMTSQIGIWSLCRLCRFWQIFVEALVKFAIYIIQSMKSTSTRESSETKNHIRRTCIPEVMTLSLTGGGQEVVMN